MSEYRGQTAVEYLLVFSTSLVIIASVTMAQMITPSSNAANDALLLSQARSAVNAIVDAIDTAFSNGPGAVKSVTFPMNVSWDLQLDNAENKVRISIGDSSGVENIVENLHYDIENFHSLTANASGTSTVIVEWVENDDGVENLFGGDDMKIYIYIKPRGG